MSSGHSRFLPRINCPDNSAMTVYEHAMIGINGTLALGLQRRQGWQIVAWAGLAALLPDADGVTILFGGRAYADGHRLWGHNLLVVGLVAAAVSVVVYRSDVLTRVQRRLAGAGRRYLLATR